MNSTELVYFGKPGSFTHLVAQQISPKARLISKGTVQEVVDYVQKKKSRRGIVPIENSSGGMIPDTVDHLVSEENRKLMIQEEYALNVRLALLGKKKDRLLKKVYSHFVPFHHCGKWLKENYPDVEQVVVESTSAAALSASQEKYAAAIAPQSAAVDYQLDILHFPINADVRNLTQFFVLGHGSNKKTKKSKEETSLSVVLKNEIGSLCHFLKPFALHGINLKRITSRNVMGQPNTYIFFVGIEAGMKDKGMIKAMDAARNHCSKIRVLGSYPVYPPFES
jgi:chorismate mutase / prephenate dehydratase